MIALWRGLLALAIAVCAASIVAGCHGRPDPCNEYDVARIAAFCRLRVEAECKGLPDAECPVIRECDAELERICG